MAGILQVIERAKEMWAQNAHWSMLNPRLEFAAGDFFKPGAELCLCTKPSHRPQQPPFGQCNLSKTECKTYKGLQAPTREKGLPCNIKSSAFTTQTFPDPGALVITLQDIESVLLCGT